MFVSLLNRSEIVSTETQLHMYIGTSIKFLLSKYPQVARSVHIPPLFDFNYREVPFLASSSTSHLPSISLCSETRCRFIVK